MVSLAFVTLGAVITPFINDTAIFLLHVAVGLDNAVLADEEFALKSAALQGNIVSGSPDHWAPQLHGIS